MHSIVETAKGMGLRVFMRKPDGKWPKAEHCYITDGTRIAYAQWSDIRGPYIGTVHVPNKTVGSGYEYATGNITEKEIEGALSCVAPGWESARDRACVRKWKDWDTFHNSSRFNSELVEV